MNTIAQAFINILLDSSLSDDAMDDDDDVDDEAVEDHAERTHEVGKVVHPFTHFSMTLAILLLARFIIY